MIISKTPLRITLAGGGSDIWSFSKYHGSHVISMAINKYIYIVCNEITARQIILKYSKTEVVTKINQIQHKLIKQIFIDNKFDNNVEISSFADLESNSGLGSSGSFAVGLTNIVHTFCKRKKSQNYVLASKAYESERKTSKDLVGYQDTFIAQYGGITEFKSMPKSEKIKVKKINLNKKFLNDLTESIFIIDTGIRRSANNVLSKQVYNESKNKSYIEIFQLAKEIKKTLINSNLKEYSYLNKLHWDLKIKKGNFIVHPDIRDLIDKLLIDSLHSCKLIGAGYGGYLLGISLNSNKTNYKLKKLGLNFFQINLSNGSELFSI
tara:strand:+ start:8627 stop:9592 length:966 start_codon:yes stop_codon:yes gene_type:complete